MHYKLPWPNLKQVIYGQIVVKQRYDKEKKPVQADQIYFCTDVMKYLRVRMGSVHV